MNNKIVAFIKRMEEQGRALEVNGNFVVISPAAGLAISDMLEMQNLNKRGELAKYVTQLRQEAAQ